MNLLRWKPLVKPGDSWLLALIGIIFTSITISISYISIFNKTPQFIIDKFALKSDDTLIIKANNSKANQKKYLDILFDGYPFPKKGKPIDKVDGMQQWSFRIKQHSKNEFLIKDGEHKIRMSFPGEKFSDEYKILFVSNPPIVEIKKSIESEQAIVEGKVATELQLPKHFLSVCITYFQDGKAYNIDNIPLTKKTHIETGITYFEFKTILQGFPILHSDSPDFSKTFWGIKVIDQAGNEYFYNQSYAKFMAPGEESFGVGNIAKIKVKKQSKDIHPQELLSIVRIIPNPTVIDKLPNGKPPIELKVQSIDNNNTAKINWKFNISSIEPLTLIYKNKQKIGASVTNEFIDYSANNEANYRVEQVTDDVIYRSPEIFLKKQSKKSIIVPNKTVVKVPHELIEKFSYKQCSGIIIVANPNQLEEFTPNPTSRIVDEIGVEMEFDYNLRFIHKSAVTKTIRGWGVTPLYLEAYFKRSNVIISSNSTFKLNKLFAYQPDILKKPGILVVYE